MLSKHAKIWRSKSPSLKRISDKWLGPGDGYAIHIPRKGKSNGKQQHDKEKDDAGLWDDEIHDMYGPVSPYHQQENAHSSFIL